MNMALNNIIVGVTLSLILLSVQLSSTAPVTSTPCTTEAPSTSSSSSDLEIAHLVNLRTGLGVLRSIAVST